MRKRTFADIDAENKTLFERRCEADYAKWPTGLLRNVEMPLLRKALASYEEEEEGRLITRVELRIAALERELATRAEEEGES